MKCHLGLGMKKNFTARHSRESRMGDKTGKNKQKERQAHCDETWKARGKTTMWDYAIERGEKGNNAKQRRRGENKQPPPG